MAIVDPEQAVTVAYSWFVICKRRTSRTWHECVCAGCCPPPLNEEEQTLLLDLIEKSWKTNPTRDFLRVVDVLMSWSVYHDDSRAEHLPPFVHTVLTSLQALHQHPAEEEGFRFSYAPIQVFLEYEHLKTAWIGSLLKGTVDAENMLGPPEPLGAVLAKVWSRMMDTGRLMEQRGDAWYGRLPLAALLELLRDIERCYAQEYGREVTNQQGYKEVLEVNT